ncbi:MAG: hypothetical protein KBT33_04480 [Prevotellaceae bacterium]|nr:hypothetical protein [Candidatus Minthosoma equi]
MRKLVYFVSLILVSSVFTTTSCGPSAADKAREDSIRIADSIYRVDSARIADSLKNVKAQEEEITSLRKAVDDAAAKMTYPYIVKVPSLFKVVYADYRVRHITVLDVKTNETKKIKMPFDCDEEHGPSITKLELEDDGKSVTVKIRDMGSMPFYNIYSVNIETEKIKVISEDF